MTRERETDTQHPNRNKNQVLQRPAVQAKPRPGSVSLLPNDKPGIRTRSSRALMPLLYLVCADSAILGRGGRTQGVSAFDATVMRIAELSTVGGERTASIGTSLRGHNVGSLVQRHYCIKRK